MKRATKPPTPSQLSERDDPSRAARARVPAGAGPGRPPPLPGSARTASPFAVAAPQAVPRTPEGPEPITEDLARSDLDTHRPAAPTIPFVPDAGADWRPGQLPAMTQEPLPSSRDLPTGPKRPPSDRSMEAALRDQMWRALNPNPTQSSQTGPHLPLHLQRGYGGSPPVSTGQVISSPPVPSTSGTYRTISEQREGSVSRSDRTPAAADDGWPLGYIVASAFFLAIAVVGFGLWLAFAVIAL